MIITFAERSHFYTKTKLYWTDVSKWLGIFQSIKSPLQSVLRVWFTTGWIFQLLFNPKSSHLLIDSCSTVQVINHDTRAILSSKNTTFTTSWHENLEFSKLTLSSPFEFIHILTLQIREHYWKKMFLNHLNIKIDPLHIYSYKHWSDSYFLENSLDFRPQSWSQGGRQPFF